MNEFEGSSSAVTSAFQTHLLKFASTSSSYSSSGRPRLIDMIQNKELLTDDDIPILNTEALFQNVDLTKLKKEEFQLQESYKKQAENQLQVDINPTLQLSTVFNRSDKKKKR